TPRTDIVAVEVNSDFVREARFAIFANQAISGAAEIDFVASLDSARDRRS
ncbi:unnamed protein product, partial [marine sediment metagenome]